MKCFSPNSYSGVPNPRPLHASKGLRHESTTVRNTKVKKLPTYGVLNFSI